MIHGVGTDIVATERLATLYRRHGERALERILAAGERDECRRAADPARFLAKRFAAKEAFAKALGSGVRPPALLPNIAVTHDSLGRPGFTFAPELDAHLAEQGLTAHLSISDEQGYAVAFVVMERR